jgi:hypothetical protein
MASFSSHVLVYPRIWWREPLSNVLSQLVTCMTASVFQVNDGDMEEELTSFSVHVARKFLHLL